MFLKWVNGQLKPRLVVYDTIRSSFAALNNFLSSQNLPPLPSALTLLIQWGCPRHSELNSIESLWALLKHYEKVFIENVEKNPPKLTVHFLRYLNILGRLQGLKMNGAWGHSLRTAELQVFRDHLTPLPENYTLDSEAQTAYHRQLEDAFSKFDPEVRPTLVTRIASVGARETVWSDATPDELANLVPNLNSTYTTYANFIKGRHTVKYQGPRNVISYDVIIVLRGTYDWPWEHIYQQPPPGMETRNELWTRLAAKFGTTGDCNPASLQVPVIQKNMGSIPQIIKHLHQYLLPNPQSNDNIA